MAEKPKNKPTKKTKKLLEDLESLSTMDFAKERYRETRGAGGSRISALQASVKRYGEAGEAKRTLATGKKGGAEEFFKYAGFENLGMIAGALFDRKATKEETEAARQTLGMNSQEEEKKEKKEKGGVDSKKVDYIVKSSQDIKAKMASIYGAIAQIDKNVSYIVDRVAPKLLEAKEEGGEGRKLLQFDPLAPAGEQFRQIADSGKATVAKAPKEYMKSATMKAALMGSMPPPAAATTGTFQDPTEKSFTEEFAKEDPIAILRQDMNTNFEKLFKILEEQKEQMDSMNTPLGSLLSMVPTVVGLGSLGPMLKKVGGVIPKLGKFLGPAGAAAMAGYIGYEVGSWLNEKFKLSDKLLNLMPDPDITPEQRKKAAEESKLPGQDERLAEIGWKQETDDEGNRIYTDLKSNKTYRFNELTKEQQNAIVDARMAVPKEPSGMRGAPIPAQYEEPYDSVRNPMPGTEGAKKPAAAASSTPLMTVEQALTPTGKISEAAPNSGPPLMMKSAANKEGGIPNVAPTPPKKVSNQQGKNSMIKALDKKGVTDPKARAAIMAQVAHESGGFTQLSENLKYSPPRLKQVFSYYKRNPEEAAIDAGNPVAVASKAYASRLGNGPPPTGDGWEYRGRGFIQLTGKSNYNRFGVNNPDDLLSPDKAAENAVNYMLGYKGDWSDVAGVTRYVNGNAMLGLSERAGYFDSFLNDPEVTQGGSAEAAAGGDTSSSAAAGAGGGAIGVAAAPVGDTGNQEIQSALGSLTSMAGAAEAVAGETALQQSGVVSGAPGGPVIPAATGEGTVPSEQGEGITKSQTNALLDIAAQNRAKNSGISVEQAKSELSFAPQATIQPIQTVSGMGMDVASQAMEMGKATLAATQAAPTIVMPPAQQAMAPQQPQQKTNPLAVLGEVATRAAESAFQRAISKDFSHPTAFTTIGTI
jgi:putative chitinase